MRRRIIPRRRVIVPKAAMPKALLAPMGMNQELTCRLCVGSGRFGGECLFCEARGQVRIAGEAIWTCAYCTGSGKVYGKPCSVCGGMGLLDENRQPVTVIRRNGQRMLATAIWLANQVQVATLTQAPIRPPAHTQFVAPSRIDELRACAHPSLDFKKLIRLCEETNANAEEKCWYSVAALTRAVIDHVPPAFGYQKFEHVVANYAGGRSFKDAIRRLDEASRKIADAHLHEAMRVAEVLPTFQQVNCGQELDVLLGEIVRITPKGSKAVTP